MDGAMPERGRLLELLTAAKSPLDAESVDGLIAGVLAAPPEIGASWHRLVADPTPPDLAAALDARKAALAASHRDGIEPDDFARLSRAARLRRLRDKLAADGFAGFIVPRADEHQGEYVPLRGQRLAWLTGFTGSAGMAIVLKRSRRDLCRRPLHAAGGGAGRYRGLRNPPSDRRTANNLARGRGKEGRRHWLRPVAAHAAGGRAAVRRGRARRR